MWECNRLPEPRPSSFEHSLVIVVPLPTMLHDLHLFPKQLVVDPDGVDSAIASRVHLCGNRPRPGQKAQNCV